jgi:hypothetical protein
VSAAFLSRPRAALAVAIGGLALALSAAGCGGDDEDSTNASTDKNAGPPTKTVTVPTQTTPKGGTGTGTTPSEEKKGTGSAPAKGKSPEDQPGGAGDEEPARSEVVLTGKGGRIGPLLVKVPPFIAIHVELRSGDGKPYVIGFGRRILRVGPKGARSSATFAGLRPGKRLSGAAVSGKVVIEASAEPGP